MQEVANCPLCGEAASIFRLDDDPVTFSHCGMQANSVELWNRYAAAMELAKTLVLLSECDINPEHYKLEKQIEVAERRVLEVFK